MSRVVRALSYQQSVVDYLCERGKTRDYSQRWHDALCRHFWVPYISFIAQAVKASKSGGTTTSRKLPSTRSVTPSDLMRTLTTSKWSANHFCGTSHPRMIPHQPLPAERKLWQSSQAPILVSLRTVTISRRSKKCSALTGLGWPSGTSASAK